jgi:hypothetical protein
MKESNTTDSSGKHSETAEKSSLWKRDMAPLAALALSWALPLATIAAWIFFIENYLLTLSEMRPGIDAWIVPLTLSFLTVGWSLIKWNWSSAPARPAVAYMLRWYQQSLGAMLVAASIAYLLIGLYSLPARFEANARVNQYIQQGEMVLVRQASPQAPS